MRKLLSYLVGRLSIGILLCYKKPGVSVAIFSDVSIFEGASMQQKQNKKLIAKVLIVGAVIAVLSYLFHPGVGQLSIMLNGEPVAEPLVRFAAVPTFLFVMVITAVLMVILFLGAGLFIFLFAMFVALAGIFIMAPYFWPVLVIVLLTTLLLAVSNGNKN
jgi:hypothetical protein